MAQLPVAQVVNLCDLTIQEHTRSREIFFFALDCRRA